MSHLSTLAHLFVPVAQTVYISGAVDCGAKKSTLVEFTSDATSENRISQKIQPLDFIKEHHVATGRLRGTFFSVD